MDTLMDSYTFRETPVRVVVVNGQPWFVAKDVCGALELVNTAMAIRALDDDEKGISKVYTLGGEQDMIVINESGMYSLVLRSNKPEARDFKRWVTHDVIPSIRKTGSYLSTPKTFIEALEALVSSEKEKERLRLEAEANAPKVELYNLLMSGENTQTMSQVAKSLGWGRNRLFSYLRDRQILMRNNLPYQRFLDMECFEVREVSTVRGDGVVNVTQTMVTAKGLDYIARLVNGGER